VTHQNSENTGSVDEKEELVPLPIPALVAVLKNLENEKGSALTHQEVLDIRDNCECVMSPISIIPTMVKSRGYKDIDPENVWEEWLEIKDASNDNT
jgi:hypothetical protein